MFQHVRCEQEDVGLCTVSLSKVTPFVENEQYSNIGWLTRLVSGMQWYEHWLCLDTHFVHIAELSYDMLPSAIIVRIFSSWVAVREGAAALILVCLKWCTISGTDSLASGHLRPPQRTLSTGENTLRSTHVRNLQFDKISVQVNLEYFHDLEVFFL